MLDLTKGYCVLIELMMGTQLTKNDVSTKVLNRLLSNQHVLLEDSSLALTMKGKDYLIRYHKDKVEYVAKTRDRYIV